MERITKKLTPAHLSNEKANLDFAKMTDNPTDERKPQVIKPTAFPAKE